MQKSISEYKYFICLLCKGMVLINFYNFLNVFIFCFQSGQEQSLSIIFYHFLLLLLSYATLTSESSKHKMCTKVIMNKPVLGLQITDNLEKNPNNLILYLQALLVGACNKNTFLLVLSMKHGKDSERPISQKCGLFQHGVQCFLKNERQQVQDKRSAGLKSIQQMNSMWKSCPQ